LHLPHECPYSSPQVEVSTQDPGYPRLFLLFQALFSSGHPRFQLHLQISFQTYTTDLMSHLQWDSGDTPWWDYFTGSAKCYYKMFAFAVNFAKCCFHGDTVKDFTECKMRLGKANILLSQFTTPYKIVPPQECEILSLGMSCGTGHMPKFQPPCGVPAPDVTLWNNKATYQHLPMSPGQGTSVQFWPQPQAWGQGTAKLI